MTQLELLGGILATVQIVCTAWLHYQTNKNACGGAKCVETMTRALHIDRMASIHAEQRQE